MLELVLAWFASLKMKALSALQWVSHRAAKLDTPLAGSLSAFAGKAAIKGERGQLGLGTILAAFVVVIAAFVVVIVVDRFDQSLGDPSSSELNNSSDSILEGFADMTSLIGPLLLVAIGIVIISLIRRVQG